MEKMVTISVKIPKRLNERLKKTHANRSRVVREILEDRIIDEEVKKLNADIKKHKKIFDKISVEAVVQDLREDRYGGH